MGARETHSLRSAACAVGTLLVLLAALALVACGGSGTVASAPPSAAPSPATSASSPAPLPAPTVAGTIAFTRFGELSADLYTVRTDGSDLTPLANDDIRDEGCPAWSPDAAALAFVRGDTGSGMEGPNFKLWLMDADGSGQRRLFHDKTAGVGPAWSPDGKKMVFSKWSAVFNDSEFYEIATVDRDGRNLAKVVRGANYGFATWAPDGRVYWLPWGKNDVYSARPDGSDVKRVTRLGNVFGYALTPDGKQMAVYQGYPRSRIVTMAVAGKSRPIVLVEPLPESISTAGIIMTWSPDGTALAFANMGVQDYGTGAPPGQLPGSDLYIVNADGTGLSVVPNTGRAAEPAWRPE